MREVILNYLKQFGDSRIRVSWLVDQIRRIPIVADEEQNEINSNVRHLSAVDSEGYKDSSESIRE